MKEETLEAIKEIVKKSLPEHVGESLQQELKELAELRVSSAKANGMVDYLRKERTGLERKITELEERDDKCNDILKRETNLCEDEAAYKLKLALTDQMALFTTDHVSMMRGILTEVFSSNKLSYGVNVSASVSGNKSGNDPVTGQWKDETITLTGNVDGDVNSK